MKEKNVNWRSRTSKWDFYNNLHKSNFQERECDFVDGIVNGKISRGNFTCIGNWISNKTNEKKDNQKQWMGKQFNLIKIFGTKSETCYTMPSWNYPWQRKQDW